jgi:hypothetical protein
MAKAIQISADNGVTWLTFPGNSGELTSEGTEIDDTIFGASYSSGQPGMIAWNISSNGLYKGFAGYIADLYMSGTTTAMAAEPMALVSGKTYQVTNTAKRTFDPAVALSFFDGGTPISAANILNVDYLWGRVTFVGGFTPAGAVTVTGNYLPLATIARANSFTLTQTANAVDDTDFVSAQAADGHRSYIPGLKTASLTLGGIWNIANDWRAKLIARNRIIVEINPDGSQLSRARGFFRPTSVSQSGDVGDQEAMSADFALSVPDVQVMLTPFSWLHASGTTLNASIQAALTAYQNNLIYDYRYLADGTNGYSGDGIITDLTLAGGLDVMNEFTVAVQGSGPLAPVP